MSENVEQKLWEKVNKGLPVLRHIPFLRMVAVCNNLAFGKVDNGSDIDLFIVAKKGRLFLVRLMVTFLLHFKGVRRHGKKIAGRFCLSFFVDDSCLDLSRIAIENDIYLAYWIKTMMPVIDDGVFDKFIEKNKWCDRYFKNVEEFIKNRTKGIAEIKEIVLPEKKFLNWLLGGFFGDFLEFIIKKWQTKRALKKASKAGAQASLIVEDHMLKFHNVDRRQFYRDKWFSKYDSDVKLTEKRFLFL